MRKGQRSYRGGEQVEEKRETGRYWRNDNKVRIKINRNKKERGEKRAEKRGMERAQQRGEERACLRGRHPASSTLHKSLF